MTYCLCKSILKSPYIFITRRCVATSKIDQYALDSHIVFPTVFKNLILIQCKHLSKNSNNIIKYMCGHRADLMFIKMLLSCPFVTFI